MAENITNTYNLHKKFISEINYDHLNLTKDNAVKYHLTGNLYNDVNNISSIISDTEASTLIIVDKNIQNNSTENNREFLLSCYENYTNIINKFCNKSPDNKVILIYNAAEFKGFQIYTDNDQKYYSIFASGFFNSNDIKENYGKLITMSCGQLNENTDQYTISAGFIFDKNETSKLSSFHFQDADCSHQLWPKSSSKSSSGCKVIPLINIPSGNDYTIPLKGLESVFSEVGEELS